MANFCSQKSIYNVYHELTNCYDLTNIYLSLKHENGHVQFILNIVLTRCSQKKKKKFITYVHEIRKKNRTSGKQDVVYKNHNIATKESHGVKCSGNQK